MHKQIDALNTAIVRKVCLKVGQYSRIHLVFNSDILKILEKQNK